MSNQKKQDPKIGRILFLAKCNRTLFPTLAAGIPLLLSFVHGDKRITMLSLGGSVILYGLYQLMGYLLRWTHIFCSYQNAYHVEMTPEDVDWEWVKKSDAYGVPVVFGVIGLLCIVVSFFV